MGPSMVLEELRRELERIRRLLQVYGLVGLEEPPFDPQQGVLYPLYTFETYEDAYRILIDLPVANLDTLRVYTENGELVIEAGLEREIEMSTPWSYEHKVIVRRYRRRIALPPDADVENMQVRVYNDRKIVEIIIPRR